MSVSASWTHSATTSGQDLGQALRKAAELEHSKRRSALVVEDAGVKATRSCIRNLSLQGTRALQKTPDQKSVVHARRQGFEGFSKEPQLTILEKLALQQAKLRHGPSQQVRRRCHR